MDERDLRRLIGRVKDGRLSRRAFVQRMVAVGLTAPMAGLMLAGNGVAMAADIRSGYKPIKAGGGGALKLLWWQAPTLINPHFAVGTKDQDASRIFYEPLAAWDPDGNLVPVLAASIPSKENGALAADGRSVVWTLKPGVKWHDGKPLTADDLVFTWEYARDPATAAVTAGSYKDCKVEKIDDLSVRILFDKPTPYWCDAYVGIVGMVLPKHLFGPYSGAKSRDAPQNLAPVGIGPYRFVEFRPGDIVRGERNPDYHLPNRPYFDTVEMKGGGDAVSAARAVLQTGEYDHASEMTRHAGRTFSNHVIDPTAPSAARVVHRHFGAAAFPRISAELMAAVDKADSAQFTRAEILDPQGWVLLNFLMDSRTGLGRFRDFRISNYELMMQLIEHCRDHSIAEVLALPDVRERVDLYNAHRESFVDQLRRCTSVHGKLALIDLRDEEVIYAGNRFTVYALFPDCDVSALVMWGLKKQNTVFAIGKSVLDRGSQVDVGALCLDYGGGGHRAAGTCQIANARAEAVKAELIAALSGDSRKAAA